MHEEDNETRLLENQSTGADQPYQYQIEKFRIPLYYFYWLVKIIGVEQFGLWWKQAGLVNGYVSAQIVSYPERYWNFRKKPRPEIDAAKQRGAAALPLDAEPNDARDEPSS